MEDNEVSAARRGIGMAGKELFEIKPVVLGGDPVDPSNKVSLNRADHIRAVAFWNRFIKKLRDTQARATGPP